MQRFCLFVRSLGVRNVTLSIESSILSPIFEISLHVTLLNTLHYVYNIPEHKINAFCAICLVHERLGTRVCAASTVYYMYINYNYLSKQVTACISQVSY